MQRETADDYFERETPEGFAINDDKTAEWALKKIKAAQAEHDRLMDLVNAERDELNEKELELDRRLESETGYLKALLYNYFETVEKKETKTQQSYKLLSGSLIFKKPSVSIVKPDNDQLVAFLESVGREDLIDVKRTAAWGEYKKSLTIADDGQVVSEDGEILDFIQTEEKAGEFNVK